MTVRLFANTAGCAFCKSLLCLTLVWLLSSTVASAKAPKPDREKNDAKSEAEQALSAADRAAAAEKNVTQGALRIVGKDGSVVECPLKHTDVDAEISGFLARVKVTQTFTNPTKEKIEAVYVFPLPHEAAIDAMTMLVGERKIVGQIKRRDEARRIYEQALFAGQTTALLEQERPNIFTQSVGNIKPGEEVRIEISYVDTLAYDMGSYEFHFPMVVGPRYIPGTPNSPPVPAPKELQGKVAPPVANTNRVPDAARISPPVLKPGVRNGHDISLRIKLDAGVPVQAIKVANHQASVKRDGPQRAAIKLSPKDSLPNKDFVVRYHVVGKKPEMAVLAHTSDQSADAQRLGQGYFMLMIQPQEDERLTKSPPREIVFLVDVSGSMRGQPTSKVISAMQNMLKLCREKDTVQVITFASQAQKLFDKPLPVTEKSINKALAFADGLQGRGGTEMLKGVKLAIDEPIDNERLRIVVMLTDGYIGNEAQIIEHVGRHCGDQIRFWAVGIGSSPNMFLIDGVARQGGGMGKRLGLTDDTVALTQEIMTRIQRAQLAKINIDWGPHRVVETFPAKIPELWAGRPVILLGRYSGASAGAITVRGRVEGEAVSWPLSVSLPGSEAGHDVLSKVWARRKIEDLMQQSFYTGSPAVEEEVTALALNYRLMSQYTSFVAVDAAKTGDDDQPAQRPRRMLVPVPLPEGTMWEGFFGEGTVEWGMLAADRLDRSEAPAIAKGRFNIRRTRERKQQQQHPASQLAAPPLALRGSAAPMNRPSAAMPFSGSASEQLNRLASVNGRAAAGNRFSPQRTGGARRQSLFSPVEKSRALGRAKNPAQAGRLMHGNGLPTQLFERDGELAAGDAVARDYTSYAFRTDAAKSTKAAQAAIEQAKRLINDKAESAKIRAALVKAYLLDAAAINMAGSHGQHAAEALALLQQHDARQVAAWSKAEPKLTAKLDLVLRDKSIDEALAAISKASGLGVRLLPGSVKDAEALVGHRNARVRYLDLRGASAAEALDWILLPARMRWQLSGDEIVAGTARRGDGSAAWLYDVSTIAIPSAKVLSELKDNAKATKAAGDAANRFLAAVHEQLAAEVAWYAPGQLLIVGDAKTHAAAEKLFGDLADEKSALPKALSDLHKQTARRAAERAERVAKLTAFAHRWEVAAALDAFGWQLLSSAAGGQVDLEALTELQIAWNDPATAELLAGDNAAVALQSWWIVDQTAAALPGNEELAKLAEKARASSRGAADKALADLQQKPEDASAFTATLYAALALRDEQDYRQMALPLLAKSGPKDSPLSAARVIARALLDRPTAEDEHQLATMVIPSAGNDAMVVLTALAAHRAGGDALAALRSEAASLLGRQPLDGHVVVLVNRLAGCKLPLLVEGGR